MLFFGANKRIKSIIETLDNISAGNLEQEINIYSPDNIGRLAAAINNTLSGLRQRIVALEKENSRIRTILNNMSEGVIAIDEDTRIVSVNPTAEKIFNISKESAEGKFFLEAVRNSDIAEIISSVLKNGKVISREITFAGPVPRIFRINASSIYERNNISGCLAVIHDITEIRKLETMRRDFVANVSHELKTPLTSIKGFVETLLEGALNDKENSRGFLQIIRDHTDRLDNLINDLLTLSYVESREIRLKLAGINMKKLTEEILSGFKAQLKKKAIEVKNELPQELIVKADKNRIEQVLTNLIDNAVKFNKEKGYVKIYARDSKFIVEDSGMGIPDKDIPRIFERFYRVDKARSRELGGTGLGLSIVKHIVELHGGSVGVESVEGLGSKFWFTLPRGQMLQ